MQRVLSIKIFVLIEGQELCFFSTSHLEMTQVFSVLPFWNHYIFFWSHILY